MRRLARDFVVVLALGIACVAAAPALANDAGLLGAQVLVAQAASPTPAPAADAAKDAAKDDAVKHPTTETAPAKKSALSIPACSVRYLEGKVEGKLKGVKWVDFRRDECGAKDTTAVFPTEIAPKYSTEKDVEKARTLTCADQFAANKSSNANGGLRWVEKDGGYYGECVMRLKG